MEVQPKTKNKLVLYPNKHHSGRHETPEKLRQIFINYDKTLLENTTFSSLATKTNNHQEPPATLKTDLARVMYLPCI